MHTPSMTGERRIVEWTVNLSGGFGQRSSPGASESSLVWELTGNRRALSGDVGQGTGGATSVAAHGRLR